MIFKTTAKKVLAVLIIAVLSVGLCLPVLDLAVSAEEKTVEADGINTVRGYGLLVIYTSEFGATTATNQYGFEIVVEDNVVTKAGGNNNAIPANGFVLSGHDVDVGVDGGMMKTYLMENVKVGDYVYYNDSSLVVTISDKPVAVSNFYTVDTEFDKVNDTRAQDNLIIYNTRGTYTATNQWGYEVVVEENRVVSVGGNNNLIPNKKGSFVVSGHGIHVEWLKKNIKLGMSVSYDLSSKKITFVYDEHSVTYGIKKQIEQLENDYKAASDNYRYIDHQAAKSKLDETRTAFDTAIEAYENGGKLEDFDSASSEIIGLLDEAKQLLTESRTVEYRGVWVRPTQKTKTAVESYVQQLYDAGINMISIETLYDSTMIMPMPEESLFKQNPGWKGFDMLQAYIDACHSRNMELHIWMPVYFVGMKGDTYVQLSVATQKKEWLSVTNLGGNYAPNDTGGFQMLNPANEEATQFLLDTYRYILTKYDIDGFELDYIRYWTNLEGCDFGYDEITTSAFEAEYGIKPRYEPKAAYWKKWVAFRTNYVTGMVKKVRDLVDEVNPSVLLSADVGPNIEDAYNHLYQDYMTWLDEGYLDLLHPMSYGEGFEDEIAAQVANCGDDVFISVGLGVFMNEYTAADMLRHSKMVNSLGAEGSSFFESSAYLGKGTGGVLLKSIYKKKAITPTFDKAAATIAVLEYSKGRIDEVILPLSGMSEEEANIVKKAFDAVIADINAEKTPDDSFSAAKNTIDSLENANAKTALNTDLDYASKIAKIAKRVPDDYEVSAYTSSAPESEPSSQPVAEKPPAKGWIVPVVIVAVIAAAGVLAALLIKKKKNK